MKSFLFSLLTLITFSVSAAEIDTKESSFVWTGTKVTGKHFGKISVKSSKVDIKDGKLSGGEIIMDMNSITVDDMTGKWMTKLLNHLKDDDFFTVSKFPTAKLVIKKVYGGKVDGELTIKGKTNPISFNYMMSKDKKKYTGKMTFDRTKYGIVYKSGNFFKDLGDKIIHDEVSIDYTLVVK